MCVRLRTSREFRLCLFHVSVYVLHLWFVTLAVSGFRSIYDLSTRYLWFYYGIFTLCLFVSVLLCCAMVLARGLANSKLINGFAMISVLGG